ncbi:glutamate ABC transporter substrate-binding protein [Kutzneria buriramensis]|uniref:Glutamate transport system substrate-binding protein n=1 Tax=Kutzneria buriramensis TaxID=1045776 RepID=A0A3E0GZM6_9PSEU|nr:glutamate ABC transporter substrate-binding protein [Kutzneria buriramensis]REH35795.1 glutamate transport system substrate-binding protein [Kutzneria buriramensis]
MRPRKLLRAAAALAALALFTTACGADGHPGSLSADAAAGKLTIGIRYDQPGLGEKTLNGKFQGFDVEVARYVAGELGVKPENITWKEAQPANREKLLTGGQVDMVVAAYTISDERKKLVDFAGPYFHLGQDLLVRLDDNSITGPESLNGKRLCTTVGTTSAQAVKDQFAHEVTLVEYPRYTDCITALLAGLVDAVTTGDVILAGYAAQNPELLRVVGKPFTNDFYGIGLRKGDPNGKARVNAAIEKMVSTGAWTAAAKANLGASGYQLPKPPAITER